MYYNRISDRMNLNSTNSKLPTVRSIRPPFTTSFHPLASSAGRPQIRPQNVFGGMLRPPVLGESGRRTAGASTNAPNGFLAKPRFSDLSKAVPPPPPPAKQMNVPQLGNNGDRRRKDVKPVELSQLWARENLFQNRHLFGGSGKPKTLCVKELSRACLSSDPKTRCRGLEFLRGNQHIQELWTGLYEFLVGDINKSKGSNLTCLFNLFEMAKSLLQNPSLSLEGDLIPLVNAIGCCVISEQIPVGPCEHGNHWDLRMVASRLLGQVSRFYQKHTDTNHLKLEVSLAKTLAHYIRLERPALESFYGALAGFGELGRHTIQAWIIPNIPHICDKIDMFNDDAGRIRSLLIDIVQPILRTLENLPELGSLEQYLQQPDQRLARLGVPQNQHQVSQETERRDGQRPDRASSLQQVEATSFSTSSPRSSPSSINQNVQHLPADVGSATAGVVPPTNATDNMVNQGGELHIYGFKDWITQEMIEANFGRFGTIDGLYLPKNGCGHIKFAKKEDAEFCKTTMDGKKWGGRKLKITWATVSKCGENKEYFIFCDLFGICYNYNIHDDGCTVVGSCRRKHICLFCFELFRQDRAHRSRWDCPEEKPGFEKYCRRSETGPTSQGPDQIHEKSTQAVGPN